MTHAQFRLAQRYGLSVTRSEVEALEWMIARHLVPWRALGQVRDGVLVVQVRTWGRVLYALWCPVRACLLTFLTRRMARRYAA